MYNLYSRQKHIYICVISLRVTVNSTFFPRQRGKKIIIWRVSENLQAPKSQEGSSMPTLCRDLWLFSFSLFQQQNFTNSFWEATFLSRSYNIILEIAVFSTSDLASLWQRICRTKHHQMSRGDSSCWGVSGYHYLLSAKQNHEKTDFSPTTEKAISN